MRQRDLLLNTLMEIILPDHPIGSNAEDVYRIDKLCRSTIEKIKNLDNEYLKENKING